MALAVPAAGFAGLAVSLLVIAAVLVCLGILAVLHNAFRATFGLVGWVGLALGGLPTIGPLIEGALQTPATNFERWMNNEFAKAEQKLDGVVGYFFHDLAALIRWTYNEIATHGNALYVLSTAIAGTVTTDILNQSVRNLAHYAASAAGFAEAEAHRLFGLASAGIDAISKALSGQLVQLEHEITSALAPAIRWLRGRADALARDYDTLFKKVRRLDKLLGVAGAVAILEMALPRLGLSWIKCRNWKRVGRSVCGLPTNWISDLLALVTDYLILTNVCTVIPWLERAFSDTVAPLVPTFTAVGAGFCNPADKKPPPLAVPAPVAPTVYGTFVLSEPGSGYVASGSPDRVILQPGAVL